MAQIRVVLAEAVTAHSQTAEIAPSGIGAAPGTGCGLRATAAMHLPGFPKASARKLSDTKAERGALGAYCRGVLPWNQSRGGPLAGASAAAAWVLVGGSVGGGALS